MNEKLLTGTLSINTKQTHTTPTAAPQKQKKHEQKNKQTLTNTGNLQSLQ